MSQHYLTAMTRDKKLQHCEICIHEHLYTYYAHTDSVTFLGSVTVQVQVLTGPLAVSEDFYRIFLTGIRISHFLVIQVSVSSWFIFKSLLLHSYVLLSVHVYKSSCNLTVLF
jgi:hypothetical protein